MPILIVVGHPNPDSFTHAIAAAFAAGAESNGHQVELADLHAEKFDPRWTSADQAGEIGRDIATEQERFQRASTVCLAFPLFWYGMPAMTKGWLERVFTYGWACDQIETPTQSLLPQRKVVLLIPAGGAPDYWERQGLDTAMTTIWGTGTLGYFGLADHEIHFLNGSEGSDARRAALLARAREVGETLVT